MGTGELKVHGLRSTPEVRDLNDSISQPGGVSDVLERYLFRYANDLSNSQERKFARTANEPICLSFYAFFLDQLQTALHHDREAHLDDRIRRKNRRRKKKSPDKSGLFFFNCWRREPESNRPKRLCRPLHNRFAIAP
jgi:hypothetical protein